MELIQEGDDVILYLDRKRTYRVLVEKNKEFHTHRGFIDLGSLIGQPFGSLIESSLGVEFNLLKPLIRDYVLKTDRRTQVLYPKDIGYILFEIGIGSGSRVVEAGTGSGALTMALADTVRPCGEVFTYDINSKFQETAVKNITRAGLMSFVHLRNADVTTGIGEEGVDAVVLDLATPWLVVEHAWGSLKGGGIFLSFSPTIEQVMKTVYTLSKYPFIEQKTVELIMRKIYVSENRTRPETLMIGHSGYITSARKILEN
jgi:tRNA (adenine57-N1/adenine58-N1)-methyltransferase